MIYIILSWGRVRGVSVGEGYGGMVRIGMRYKGGIMYLRGPRYRRGLGREGGGLEIVINNLI